MFIKWGGFILYYLPLNFILDAFNFKITIQKHANLNLITKPHAINENDNINMDISISRVHEYLQLKMNHLTFKWGTMFYPQNQKQIWSVPIGIISEVVWFNPCHGRVYFVQPCVMKFVSRLALNSDKPNLNIIIANTSYISDV